MVIGAHPDDPDAMFGGGAMLCREHGHSVCMVSMTNGNAGHHEMRRTELAKRRHEEAMAAAKIMDVEYLIMSVNDCELFPTLENRNMLITEMRKFKPDLIITHPPCDYHPDHRYTSQLVIDTSYLLIVPAIVPEIRPLTENPFYFFSVDSPMSNMINAVLPIDRVWNKKVKVWHQHESQMYEWLPWTRKKLDEVPKTEVEKLKYLSSQRGARHIKTANNFRDLLICEFGEGGKSIRYAEGFCTANIGKKLIQDDLVKSFSLSDFLKIGDFK